MKKILFTLCLLLGATTLAAQSHRPSDISHQPSDRLSAQSHQPSDIRPQPSDRMAAYREAIGLDMTVPDFSTKNIDAKEMGTRLAGILEYLLENYKQGTYERQITLMIGEQVEELKLTYFNIKKMKFVSASKKGNEITILLRIWPDKTIGDMKQVDLSIHFKDGASDSRTANEMFSTIGHYVQLREQK